MEKMYTKRGFLNAVIAKMNGVEAEEAWTNEIIAQYAAEMIEKMEEANAKRKTKVTEKQLENEALKKEILTRLGAEPKTATVVGEELEISTQKASALLRQLVKEEKAIQNEVKITGKGMQKGYTMA